MSLVQVVAAATISVIALLTLINWNLSDIKMGLKESNRLKKLELQYKGQETIPVSAIHEI